jgi:hypothetical protein
VLPVLRDAAAEAFAPAAFFGGAIAALSVSLDLARAFRTASMQRALACEWLNQSICSSVSSSMLRRDKRQRASLWHGD